MVSARGALLDQLVVSGSNFLTVVLAARFLLTDDVAKYAYAFGFYMFVFMVAYAWLYQNLMAMDRAEATMKLAGFAKLNLLMVLGFLPVSIVLFQLLVSHGSFNGSWGTWESSLLVGAFIAVNQIIDFERRILYFTDHAAWQTPALISMLGFAPRVLMLIIFSPTSYDLFIFIIILSSSLGVVFFIQTMINRYDGNFSEFVVSLLKDGKWMTLNIPVNWAWGQAPLYLIGIFLDHQAAGVFAAVRSVASFPNVGMEMIPTYFASRLSSLFSNNQTREYKRYILTVIMVGFLMWSIASICLYFFGGELLSMVLGNKFSSFSGLLLLFWLFNLLIFFNRFQILHARLIEKTLHVPLANFSALITLGASFYFFFWHMGEEGMVWSMIVGGLVLILALLVGVFLHQREVKI